MILIIGLGNPGNQYQATRHNLGFMVLDELQELAGFPAFEFAKKFNGLVSQGILAENEAILLKPQTFMNESGKAAKAIANFYKIKAKDIYVVQDEADVDLGKIKISQNANSAGHKGVQSIINELSTKDFLRFRIGIDSKSPDYQNRINSQGLEAVVLENFDSEEIPLLNDTIKKTAETIIATIKENNGFPNPKNIN
ncbi:MAG: aminoacyl-tRNA hydrolase [Candidatus Paceibacterota bacterium]